VVAHVCHPSYTGGLTRRILVKAGLCLQSKKAKGVAQGVECLSNKCKALSSSPNFTKQVLAECWWLTAVTLATQEVEIRRTLSQKNPSQKKGWWNGSKYRPSSNPSTTKINKILIIKQMMDKSVH
jgi:hypothetical protein